MSKYKYIDESSEVAVTEQILQGLIEQQSSGDIEAAHSNADEILADFLRYLGYAWIVEEWDKVDKWYA